MLETMMGSIAKRALTSRPELATVVELLEASAQFGFQPAPRWLAGLLEQEAKAAGLEPVLLEAIAALTDFDPFASYGHGYGLLTRPYKWGGSTDDMVSTAQLIAQNTNGPAWKALQTHVGRFAHELATLRSTHPGGLPGALIDYCTAASLSRETASRIAAAYVFLTVGRMVDGGGLGGLLEA